MFAPTKNIEMKARCRDIGKARQVAQALPATLLGEGEQTDTYFNSPQGRLKVRQSSFDEVANVVWYMRGNEVQPRESEYRLARLRNPEKIAEIFALRFGVRGTVKKRRTVFVCNGIRINLDTVEGLGDFIEFEAPIDGDPRETQKAVVRLMQTFGIGRGDLVAGSYIDLLTK